MCCRPRPLLIFRLRWRKRAACLRTVRMSEYSCKRPARTLSQAAGAAALALCCATPLASWAQGAPASLPLVIGQGSGGTSFSVPIQTLLFFTALSFLPAILLMMTGFTRIVIVLSLMRQALGTQSAPPNQVIIGLSLFLTLFVMGPTLDRVYQEAYVPYTTNAVTFEQAIEKAEAPMRDFMLKQTRQSDRSEEHTSELQSHLNLVSRLLLQTKKHTRTI